MKEEDLKKIFGKRVRFIRKERNLTQEQLSEMTDMDPQHFCKLENGTHFPSPKNLVKIANALNVDLFDLFTPTSKNKTLDKIFIQAKALTDEELEFVLNTIYSLLKLRKT